MELDLNKYRINKKFILDAYNNDKNSPIAVTIARCALATHCPNTVLAHYLCEELGYIPELTDIIDRLTKFYGYKSILGQKEGSPYLTTNKKDDISKEPKKL